MFSDYSVYVFVPDTYFFFFNFTYPSNYWGCLLPFLAIKFPYVLWKLVCRLILKGNVFLYYCLLGMLITELVGGLAYVLGGRLCLHPLIWAYITFNSKSFFSLSFHSLGNHSLVEISCTKTKSSLLPGGSFQSPFSWNTKPWCLCSLPDLEPNKPILFTTLCFVRWGFLFLLQVYFLIFSLHSLYLLSIWNREVSKMYILSAIWPVSPSNIVFP